MKDWRIKLTMPLVGGTRVEVQVYDPDTNELRAMDQGDIVSLSVRTRIVAGLVKQLGLTEGEAENFTRELNKLFLQARQKYQEQTLAASAGQRTAADLLEEMPEEVRLEAERLLHSPDLVQQIGRDIESLGVAGEYDLALSLYGVGVSRLLPQPLNARVHGPTSSGKSYIVDRVSRLFPPESVIHATQITPQAFFHLEPGALEHRLVVAGERSRKEDDEAAEKTRALRELQASGRLSKLVSMKAAGGQIVTKHIEQEGPIAFVETTSKAEVFEEDANRALTLFTDETEEQTRRILRALAAGYQGRVPAGQPKAIIDRHFALQRMLQPIPVTVPFAEQLEERLDHGRVEVRRGFPQIMSLIQAITLLYQCQRGRDRSPQLVATPADYALARRLIEKPMVKLLGAGLSEPAQRFFERLAGRFRAPFTTTEVRKAERFSKDAVRAWLGELHEAGVVKVVTESRGRTPATWELTGTEPLPASVLPTAAELFGL
jgi:hypothetical protein